MSTSERSPRISTIAIAVVAFVVGAWAILLFVAAAVTELTDSPRSYPLALLWLLVALVVPAAAFLLWRRSRGGGSSADTALRQSSVAVAGIGLGLLIVAVLLAAPF